MAVRRLAPKEIQPEDFVFTPENAAWAERIIAKYPEGRQASAVISLLWKAQEQGDGWVSEPAIRAVANLLGMPYIRVLEVATFYTMFNLQPVGRYFIQFCGTTPCRLRGAQAIQDVLEQRVGHQGHVTDDGLFSWLEVECLGACCNAPMVQINDDYYEDLTPDNFNKLLDDLASGRAVKPGPQDGRVSSEPQDAVNTLLDPALYDGSVVGAWRKRFEEEDARVKAEAEAKAAAEKAAADPTPARPETTRGGEQKAETPADRVANGKDAAKPEEKKAASPATAPGAEARASEDKTKG
ncbi:NADH-quinone oxidoreductase subunit E [Pseudochelatococcus contaminans]|uniref:NADH-quinone oxidoreductase subunit E n=1 Tax=Pseudochelatococcus contaminans TaxID=1538103 RepID=A0A7W6EFQ6_9HYPH|nr:NADH-quinone oxidoreductase subunit E [Pseudochelatococcus contaminans]